MAMKKLGLSNTYQHNIDVLEKFKFYIESNHIIHYKKENMVRLGIAHKNIINI